MERENELMSKLTIEFMGTIGHESIFFFEKVALKMVSTLICLSFCHVKLN